MSMILLDLKYDGYEVFFPKGEDVLSLIKIPTANGNEEHSYIRWNDRYAIPHSRSDKVVRLRVRVKSDEQITKDNYSKYAKELNKKALNELGLKLAEEKWIIIEKRIHKENRHSNDQDNYGLIGVYDCYIYLSPNS